MEERQEGTSEKRVESFELAGKTRNTRLSSAYSMQSKSTLEKTSGKDDIHLEVVFRTYDETAN